MIMLEFESPRMNGEMPAVASGLRVILGKCIPGLAGVMQAERIVVKGRSTVVVAGRLRTAPQGMTIRVALAVSPAGRPSRPRLRVVQGGVPRKP